MEDKCKLCNKDIMAEILGGFPYLQFKHNLICQKCFMDLIEPIYLMAGVGDGGLIHIIFQRCLYSSHNRVIRQSLAANKKLLERLLVKYKFRCVRCRVSADLTIDHIKPVKHGGTDDFSNLQILCRSCNSKKGSKWNDQEREPNLPSTEKSFHRMSGSPPPGN